MSETLGPPTSETMRALVVTMCVGYLVRYASIEELLDASQVLNREAGDRMTKAPSKAREE